MIMVFTRLFAFSARRRLVIRGQLMKSGGGERGIDCRALRLRLDRRLYASDKIVDAGGKMYVRDVLPLFVDPCFQTHGSHALSR